MKTLKNIIQLSSVIFAITLSSFQMAQAKDIDPSFFNNVDAFLKKHVTNSLVDYASVKSDASLTSLIKTIQEADLSGADANTKQAFYINAYNLMVINKVASKYPIKSVIDNGGFFDSDKITVANEKITLNKLEKEKLLKKYKWALYNLTHHEYH